MATLQSQLRLSLLDQVSGPIRKISGALSNFQRHAVSPLGGMMGKVIAFGGAYLGATQGIQGTVGAAMDFESAFADVKKVVNGTSAELNSMRNDVLGLSKDMPITASGFAEIYAAAGQSGIANAELKEFARTVAQVSTAWDVPVKETGQSLAEIKTQLHLGVAQVGLFADALNHLSNNSAANAPKLLEFTNRVASQGEMFGFTAEQSLAFGGAMIAAGSESEVAATSFRNMGNALTAAETASKSKRTAFSRLGLDAVKTAKSMQKNALKTTLDVIDRIQQLPEWERISVARGLFGDEARSLMPLINNSSELRRQLGLVGDQANYAGSAFNEYSIRAKTTANQLQLVRNNIAAIGIAIGDKMLPAINRGLDRILGIFNTLDERVTIFDKMRWSIEGLVAGFGAGSLSDVMSNLETMIFGKVEGVAKTQDKLAAIFARFREFGQDIRAFADAVANNPVAQFLGSLAPYGFQIMLWGVGIAFLAGTIRKLAMAMMFLSGASTIMGALKTVGSVADIVNGRGPKPPGSGRKPDGKPGDPSNPKPGDSGLNFRMLANLANSIGLWSMIPDDPDQLRATMTANAARWDRYNEWMEKNVGSPRTWFHSENRPSPSGVYAQQAIDNARAASAAGIGGSTTETLPGKTTDDLVRIDASSIAAMTRPSGTQDVRVTNPPPPPNVTVNAPITITGVMDPQAAASSATSQLGQKTKAAVESSLAGNPSQ